MAMIVAAGVGLSTMIYMLVHHKLPSQIEAQRMVNDTSRFEVVESGGVKNSPTSQGSYEIIRDNKVGQEYVCFTGFSCTGMYR